MNRIRGWLHPLNPWPYFLIGVIAGIGLVGVGAALRKFLGA